MQIRGGLLLFLTYQCLPSTLVAAPLALGYVLLTPGVLHWRTPFPAVFIVVHSWLLGSRLGRFRASDVAFLYTRGYSRDSLWLHTVLASALSVLMAWLPGALTVWAGLRSLVQNRVFVSPSFPIMAVLETWVPVIWLAGYLTLLPLFHCVWIRAAQPTRGRASGFFLATGLLAAALAVTVTAPRAFWFRWVMYGAGGVIAAVALLAGWRLHRQVEVEA